VLEYLRYINQPWNHEFTYPESASFLFFNQQTTATVQIAMTTQAELTGVAKLLKGSPWENMPLEYGT
jgi:hypothetical protein